MTILAFVGLLLLTVGWVTLPLLPALREFFRPTDVEPLTMVGRDNADIGRFARHFREYLQAQLALLPPAADGGDQAGALQDGTAFLRLARLPNEMTRTELPAGAGSRLVITDQTTVLEGGEHFSLEIWAREDFFGGPGATYRAVLGEKNVELGERSLSLRWLHSVGTLVVGPGSHLYGRTSSDAAIRLAGRVGFDRLGAPVISAGTNGAREMPPRDLTAVASPIAESRRLGDHTRVDRDLVVPPGALVEGHLVVAGTLTLGKGARVTGSVKTHGAVRLEEGVVLEGSLVSRGDVVLGPRAWVRGPLIAEAHVDVGRGAGIGAPSSPTTLSCRTVSLEPGATVCGHIVTEEGGQTED